MTANPLYQGCSYGALIVRAIERWPERVCLIDRAESVTYGELGARIARAIQALKALGLRHGDGFGLLAGNRIDAFVVMAAGFIAGFRYTPMHPLGSEDDHVYFLENAECKALIFDPNDFAQRGATLAARVGGLAHVLSLGPAAVGTDLLAAADALEAEPLVVETAEDDLMMIAYTGGTTGQSKGVTHTHRSLVMNALLCLAEWQWPREIRLLLATPLSHAAGYMVVPALLRGGFVVCEPGFDEEAMLAAIERHRITATFLVPTMIYRLLDHPKTKATDISSMETIIYGAAPMSPRRLQEGCDVFGPVFFQLYAQYEAPNTITMLTKDHHDPAHPERLSACGMPLAGLQFALLDEDGAAVPAGAVGEICVRGPLVMQGYWNKPEETAHAFRHGWLHTGDMARRDEHGFHYIVDRAKDMIISGGFNVYPREIEDVLTTHPAVSQAAVIGVPDGDWGEAVKAVVVKKPGETVSEAALIALVREKKGPVYAPKTVDFAVEIPVTSLGKPDKKTLRAPYWQGKERQVN